MPPEETRVKRRIDEFTALRPSSVTPDIPKSLLLEVSNLCNHKCIFCAYPKMTRPGRRMDLAMAERILREAYELGTREAGFYSGAEPFTSPDLEQIVKIAKGIGYEYTFISTNGSLATEKRLKAIIDNGLDSIKFSINGADAETYKKIHGQDHFDRVIRHLKFASRYREEAGLNLYIAVSFVLIDNGLGSNAGSQERLRDLVGDYVDELVFCEAMNDNGQMMGLAPMDITAPCPLPFFRIHVSAEGYLRMCCNDYQNYLSLVDLNKTTLRDAWYSEIFQQMRRRHLENNLERTLCYNCIYNTHTPIEPIVPELAVKVDQSFFLAKKTASS